MPFYCIYMSYSTRYVSLLKIKICAVRSEQNVENKNVFSVSTVFTGQFSNFFQSLLNFPTNSFLLVKSLNTLLEVALGSNLTLHFKFLKYIFLFYMINDFKKSKQ